MSFDPRRWTRLEFEGTPIYVDPELPDWFVPNGAADALLRTLENGEPRALEPAARRLLDRLPPAPAGALAEAHPGRAAVLETQALDELWLHVTQRCDLACRHCLFACSEGRGEELSAERLLARANEARALGCRVVALTGGEPFLHREIEPLLRGLLADESREVAILTHGGLLESHAAWLRQLDRSRLHLQISVDGLPQSHDRIRGEGAFEHLSAQLAWLRGEKWPFTLSMCVDSGNCEEMAPVVDLAAELGAANVHFMWYLVRGRGRESGMPSLERVEAQLRLAAERARHHGLAIDNLENLRAQVFAPPGTRHDGSSAGWSSIALGPDEQLYPSPALVGLKDLRTELFDGLATGWRESVALDRLRTATVAGADDPLRFLLGGGDADHSFLHGGEFVGTDPYLPLHRRLALWLIAERAAATPDEGPPRLRLKMGDRLESCGGHGRVTTVHNNCLLALTRESGTEKVGSYYAEAAKNPREDIKNPVHYGDEAIAHVPESARVRSYGCGSPVLDAAPAPGETVVDLGSGTGIECFIAAKEVGADGRVIGVDMLDVMLEHARGAAPGVAERLGFANVEFRKGKLDALPLEDASVDLILSNCVLNLTEDKRETFAEILRVLKPGGRLVVSDVVTETEPGPAIRSDETLRGECLGGALTERDCAAVLAPGEYAVQAHHNGHDHTPELEQALRRALTQPVPHLAGTLKPAPQIAVARHPEDGIDFDTLIHHADHKLADQPMPRVRH